MFLGDEYSSDPNNARAGTTVSNTIHTIFYTAREQTRAGTELMSFDTVIHTL